MIVMGLLWQSLAMACPVHTFDADEFAHALLHWSEQAHRHDEDGSVHQEASNEAIQHVTIDGALLIAGLWMSWPWPTFAPQHDSVPIANAATAPSADLRPLRKPPRTC